VHTVKKMLRFVRDISMNENMQVLFMCSDSQNHFKKLTFLAAVHIHMNSAH